MGEAPWLTAPVHPAAVPLSPRPQARVPSSGYPALSYLPLSSVHNSAPSQENMGSAVIIPEAGRFELCCVNI